MTKDLCLDMSNEFIHFSRDFIHDSMIQNSQTIIAVMHFLQIYACSRYIRIS